MQARPRWGSRSQNIKRLIIKVATKEARMKEDRQQEDMRLVTQLDQKVSDQQVRKRTKLFMISR